MLYIHNTTIYTPHRRIENGAIMTEGERVLAVGRAEELPCPQAAQRLDAHGRITVPGFIDLQINGAFGDDFTADPATIWRVAEKLPRYGVTSFLPTIITSPRENMETARRLLLQGPPPGFSGAVPLGWHIEGPFLNPRKKGAHNPVYLRQPDKNFIAEWSPENGVRLVTLAPELPGALPVIETLFKRGVLVSAGHSMATCAEAQAGIEAGIRYGTHLFNAMPPLHHREPGLLGALMSDERVAGGLIADGLHVHPAVVNMLWKTLGSSRLSLVTDAAAALGMPPGRYVLGDYDVTVDDTGVRLEDGTLAGSNLALDDALRNLMRFTNCSLVEALPAVTGVPARLLGLSSQIGAIAPGSFADFVLLRPDLTIEATVVRGTFVFSSRSFDFAKD